MTPGRRGLVALAVVASVTFAVVAHLALVHGMPPAVGALLCLVPLTGLALWGLKRLRHRLLALAAIILTAGLLWQGWGLLEDHFPDVLFLEHAGSNVLLAIVFGRTLAPGREALVTRMARLVHGGMWPPLLRYTRQVTVAWTVFFLAMAATSAALYGAHLMAAWSVLVNVLNPVLLAAMFLGEYAVRHRVLPDLERIGVLGGIRAFSRHVAARTQAQR